MHSPLFQYFEIGFYRAPVTIGIYSSKWTHEFFVIRFALSRPRLLVIAPYPAIQEFIRLRKEQGEIIEQCALDNIPF
jgi:hypothetical protein